MSDQYPPQGPGDGQNGQPSSGQPPQYGQPQGGQPSYAQPQYGAPVPTGPGGEPPLWAPWYGIPFGKAIGRVFKKYATFSGRASRSEYWWWFLVNGIIAIALGIILDAVSLSSLSSQAAASNYTGSVHLPAGYWVVSIILWLYGLATLVPNLAIAWRRLHDTNKSGGWWFLGLIPFVGGIILIVFFAMPSDPAGQRFDRPA